MVSSTQTNNYKNFRQISVPFSSSYLLNNLSDMEGTKLITIKNHNKGFKAMISDTNNVKGDTLKDALLIEINDGGDCQQVKYLQANSVWYLVFC